jgi:hypothetical protein
VRSSTPFRSTRRSVYNVYNYLTGPSYLLTLSTLKIPLPRIPHTAILNDKMSQHIIHTPPEEYEKDFKAQDEHVEHVNKLDNVPMSEAKVKAVRDVSPASSHLASGTLLTVRPLCMKPSQNRTSPAGARSRGIFTVGHFVRITRSWLTFPVAVFIAFCCACANGYDGSLMTAVIAMPHYRTVFGITDAKDDAWRISLIFSMYTVWVISASARLKLTVLAAPWSERHSPLSSLTDMDVERECLLAASL